MFLGTRFGVFIIIIYETLGNNYLFIIIHNNYLIALVK